MRREICKTPLSCRILQNIIVRQLFIHISFLILMKKLLSILLLSCLFSILKAETVTYTFNFNETDFKIEAIEGDSLTISSLSAIAIYPHNNGPCIPLLCKSIALTNSNTVKDFSVTFSKRLIRENAILDNPAKAYPTSIPLNDIKRVHTSYEHKIYPDTNCFLANNYNIGGINVVNFMVSPFVYDATNGNLYFIDSLSIDIELKSNGRKKAPVNLRPQQPD